MVKGLIWRVIATMMTMTIALFVTKGDTHTAGIFGLIAFPLKFGLYMAYEQLLWKNIKWQITIPTRIFSDIDGTIVTFKN